MSRAVSGHRYRVELDDSDLAKINKVDKTSKLMEHLRQRHSVITDNKAATLDDVTAIIDAHFHTVDHL